MIPEQWTSSLTAGSREFREEWDGTGRSSQNQICTCMVRMILKSWYITWESGQKEGIEKNLEQKKKKKIKKQVTKRRNLDSWLNYYDRVTQATPRMVFISYTLNISSKPPMIVTSFLKSGQFFFPHFTNLLFELVGPKPNLV